jgi:23S rRNA pseudouridine2605 synthase
MILEGLVQVNGNAVNELGTKVSKKDVVKVDGKRIMPEKPIYILLNKPKGYITTTDDPEGRKTVMDLIDLPGKERIYPVGRLDRNTTGVLLLTNDGEFSQKLTHPSFQIKKIYRAKLDRKPSKEHMLAWVEGVELEDGVMTFEQVGFVDENDQTTLGLEVHSGRNRVVRRMFEHFKYEVEALDRVLMGEFDKIKLGRGKWRLLNDKETGYIERLKRTKPKPPPTIAITVTSNIVKTVYNICPSLAKIIIMMMVVMMMIIIIIQTPTREVVSISPLSLVRLSRRLQL